MSEKNRIRYYRKQLKISQDKLAEAVGAQKSKISKLESGDQQLTQAWMKKIAQAFTEMGLAISPSELLPDSDITKHEKIRRELSEQDQQLFDELLDKLRSASS